MVVSVYGPPELSASNSASAPMLRRARAAPAITAGWVVAAKSGFLLITKLGLSTIFFPASISFVTPANAICCSKIFAIFSMLYSVQPLRATG